MEISVIIPTYRPDSYIYECLDSVFRQTLDESRYEIIVVLNGDSEPYRSDILRYASLAGRNVTLLYTSVAGVSNARNMGLDAASGRYICFVDDDDILSPGYLEALYATAAPDTVVVSDVRCFETDIVCTGRDYLSEAYERLLREGEGVGPYFAKELLCVCCCKMIPVETIACRRFPTGFSNAEDMLFMSAVSDRIGRVRCADSSAVYYRRLRPGSLSRKPCGFVYAAGLTFRGTAYLAKIYLGRPLRYSFRFFANRVHVMAHILRLHLAGRTGTVYECPALPTTCREDTTYLSLIRIAAIYWVVLIAHNLAPFRPVWWNPVSGADLSMFDCVTPLTAYLSTMTMPLCFFVSGYVLKFSGGLRRSFGNFMKSKIQRIAVPCVVFGVLLQLLMEHRVTAAGFLGYRHLWFLRHLFLFFVAAKLLVTKRTERFLPMAVAAACLAMMIAVEFIDWIPTYMSSHLMFFMSGYAAAMYSPHIGRTARRIASAAALPVLATVIVLRYAGWNSFGFLFVLLSLPGVMAAARTLCRHERVSRLTRRLAPTSYGVYIFSFIWLIVLYDSLTAGGLEAQLAANAWWVSTVLAVVSLLLSLATTRVVKRIGWPRI